MFKIFNTKYKKTSQKNKKNPQNTEETQQTPTTKKLICTPSTFQFVKHHVSAKVPKKHSRKRLEIHSHT